MSHGFDDGWLADYRRKRAATDQRHGAGSPTREDGVTEHARSPAARSESPTPAPGTYSVEDLRHVFLLFLRENRLEIPEKEFKFSEKRGWKFDWCWPEKKLALEVEGGLFSGGRHVRGKGALDDLEKYSEAAIAGFRIIYTTPREVASGAFLGRVRRALRSTEGPCKPT